MSLIERKRIYVSIDIETTGPIPAVHGMMSLGAVAFNEEGEELSSFICNFETDVFHWHDDTYAWWCKPEQKKALEAATENKVSCYFGVRSFLDWLSDLVSDEHECQHSRVYPLCFPVEFDMPFVQWYLYKYAEFNCWEHRDLISSAIDIRSYCEGARVDKRTKPNELTRHHALYDARHQGRMFFSAMWSR